MRVIYECSRKNYRGENKKHNRIETPTKTIFFYLYT